MTDWTQRFERAGAIWRHQPPGPHARHQLTDHHSAEYFNSDVVVSSSTVMDDVYSAYLAARAGWPPVAVVAPMTSVAASVRLARELGQRSGVRAIAFDVETQIFSDELPPQVAVVTDDIHGGGSARATIKALLLRHVTIVGPLFTLANFSDQTEISGVAIRALARITFQKWRPADCPLCRAGSTAVPARREWRRLIGRQSL